LGEQSDDGLVGLSSIHTSRDPLPFSQSDAVIVGQVAAGQAYLSDNQRDTYSEFNVSVQEALTVSSSRHIQSGDSVDVERYGGAIRLRRAKFSLELYEIFLCHLLANDICYF
jgi:hypothetical protein